MGNGRRLRRALVIEAVRRIREQGHDVPIIALTAGALASQRDQALQAGMDDFILKPFEPEELVESMRRSAKRVHHEQPVPPRPQHRLSPPPSEWPDVDGVDAEPASSTFGDHDASAEPKDICNA